MTGNDVQQDNGTYNCSFGVVESRNTANKLTVVVSIRSMRCCCWRELSVSYRRTKNQRQPGSNLETRRKICAPQNVPDFVCGWILFFQTKATMTVRTIQYTASVASDVEETILQVVGQILSIDMAIIKSESTSLSVSIHNAFSCQSYVLSAVSLTGCLRLLAKNTEMEVNPEMESWLNSIEQTILPILRHGTYYC